MNVLETKDAVLVMNTKLLLRGYKKQLYVTSKTILKDSIVFESYLRCAELDRNEEEMNLVDQALTSNPATVADTTMNITDPAMPPADKLLSDKVTFARELAKPRSIATGTVTTAAAGAITSIGYFGTLFCNLTLVSNFLRRYMYFRATLCIRVRIVGTPYATGIHYLYMRPMASRGDNSATYPYVQDNVRSTYAREAPIFYTQITESIPGLYLYPNKSGDFELRLPYCNNLDFYNTTDLYLAELGIVTGTANASVSASESADFSYQIFGFLEDLELATPIYQSEKGGFISNLAGKAIRKIGGYATDYAEKAVSGYLALAGLGQPTVRPTSVNMRLKPLDYFNSDGSFSGATLSVHSNPEAPLPVGVDEMNIAYVCENRYVSERFNVADGTTSSNVATIPMNPCIALEFVTVAPDTYYYYPRPGYIARNFAYWGFDELEVCVEPISNAFQRGTLRVAFLPHKDENSLTYGYTADLADVESFYVDIGLGACASKSFKWPFPNRFVSTNPTAHTGLVVVDVVNPVKTAGVSLGVHVYYKFKGFRVANYIGLVDDNRIVGDNGTYYQSGGIDEVQSLRDIAKLMRPFTAIGNTLGVAAGNGYHRMTMDNMVQCWSDFSTDAPTNSYSPDYAGNRMTPVAFVSQLYRFMSGSLRYAVLDMTNPNTGVTEHVFVTTARRVSAPGVAAPTATWDFILIANINTELLKTDLMVFSSGGDDNSLSFTVPMNYAGRGRPARIPVSPQTLDGNGTTLSFWYPVTSGFNDTGNNRIMFQAGGDDFSCFAIGHTPTIVLSHA